MSDVFYCLFSATTSTYTVLEFSFRMCYERGNLSGGGGGGGGIGTRDLVRGDFVQGGYCPGGHGPRTCGSV